MATETKAKPTDNGQVPKGLWPKLAAIHAGLTAVKQSGYNKHLDYRYPTDSDLYEAVRPLLAQHGVLLAPSLKTLTGDGSAATVIITFRWVDSETGETHEDEWAGTGTDRGGTAIYKAYTGAIRTYLAKFFQIPTQENPEAGHGEDPPMPEQASLETVEEVAQLAKVAVESEIHPWDGKRLKLELVKHGAKDTSSVSAAVRSMTPEQAAAFKGALEA